ncbi:MAG: hypothetical protein ACK40T_09605 [Akkermansiaceae bacterium]|jgi:hypothetical protein
MFRLFLAFLVLIAPCVAQNTRIWQPIIDYTISFPGDRPDAAPMINPFENFTHMASDFGWMGPGGARIDSKGGIINVKPNGEWTGAWHSLAGLAAQKDRFFDPTDLIGLGGASEKRCGIRELAVNVSGKGLLRLELVDIDRKVVWHASVTLDSETTTTLTFPLDASTLGNIKIMSWIAEPGCKMELSSIGFLAERPEMSLEEWAFRISLGKLRRCHDFASGMTRDRGHIPAGKFDSVASTGMHALGSALAYSEGIIDKGRATQEISQTLTALQSLPTAAGFFPHFTHNGNDGRITIVPGTEFSTVDTALALHSLLLASQIVELPELNQQVVGLITRLNFDAVTDSEGWINHGYLDDGKTLLTSSWRDWGGETALVLALEAMVPHRAPRGKMIPSGEPYRGVGFIAEIQSLYFPDFDRKEPDLISSISWPDIRKKLLTAQMVYPINHWPDSAAAKAGIFGLSGGESGMPGAGYTANGTEVMGVRWIHPHYMIMSLALSDPERYPKGLSDLSANRFLYPFGLPENIDADLNLHNPMQGSLNAAFETFATYHGWKKRNTKANVIDRAAKAQPLFRKAAARFYKPL